MIDGLHFVRIRREGRETLHYVYAWRGGPCILKASGATRPKLTDEALALYQIARADTRKVKSDTLAGLIAEWQPNSPEWKSLAPYTRATWGKALDLIEARFGNLPLAVWNDPRMVAKVIEWRDTRAATPRSADIGVTVLAQLLGWGKLRARVMLNVAVGIPQLYSGADRAEIIWTDDDVDAFSVAAIKLNRPHLIDGLWLALTTGLRRDDLVGLRWSEVSDTAIIRTARKKSRGRRRRAVVPLTPKSRALLDELRGRERRPGVDTVLVNGRGTPWTPGSFTAGFGEVRNLAAIVHAGDPSLGEEDRPKHLHDCRGTFVTDLCRASLTDREIADMVAWSPANVASIRRTYVDDAAVVVAISQRISGRL